MHPHDATTVSSVAIRAKAAEVEAVIPGLHAEMSSAALAAYANPDDGDARLDADQALASLRDATDRLQQLRAAAGLAEKNEADAAASVADAKLLAIYERKKKERDAAEDAAEKATERQYDEQEILDAEQGCLDHFREQWSIQEERVEKLTARVSDLEWAATERWHRVEALEQELTALPRSTAEELAAVTIACDRRRAALAEAERAAEEDTARRLAEEYDSELVPVDPPVRIASGSFIGGSFADGMVVAVPRKDLSRLAEVVAAEEEARANPVKVISTRPPWQYLQGPPYGFGLETAIKLWADTASDEAIDFQLTLAAERNDHRALELLHR